MSSVGNIQHVECTLVKINANMSSTDKMTPSLVGTEGHYALEEKKDTMPRDRKNLQNSTSTTSSLKNLHTKDAQNCAKMPKKQRPLKNN